MKMWAGRFAKELDENINSFNSSIGFDSRMYMQDISGSITHATMLEKQGIISSSDLEKISAGLNQICQDIQSGELKFNPRAEDIHMFVEEELTSRIGESGKKLHTARSRNDQVAVDTKSYLIDKSIEISGSVRDIIGAVYSIACKHKTTAMPGYTHMQRAQPVTFAHHIMAYAGMFVRDFDRLRECRERMKKECPLGSCALAGTTYPIDRELTANMLGYYAPYSNSIDGVSDRDYVVELAGVLSLIMMHVSRLSEEIILWCSWEFKFIELDDAFATGSSIMPQKKNPDIAELARGKTGRVFGNLIGILTVMKGLPLAYNKDMQEDKEGIFDSIDTVLDCLSALTPMIETMSINKENMRNAAAKGFINATDCADYLVKKGMAFRDAYKITGEIIAVCIEERKTLESLPLDQYQQKTQLFTDDVYEAIDLENCVFRRDSYGGPATIDMQLELLKDQIEEMGEND